MSRVEKVAIIGLDCAEPSLVFGRWIEELPNIRRLMQGGLWGNLESCMPPITVPAWSCMATSKDPGTLGVYGFRNRKDHSYDGLEIATNLNIHEPRVWDILAAAGRPSITIGVPQTFPITRPPLGVQVTCFLTPSIESQYTHPPELKQEIASLVGEYMVDVKGFRTDNKQWLLDEIYDMTRKRFKLARHLLTTRPWDLFWMVEMGTDRIHHGFWQFMDRQHHRYQPDNPFENAIHDYYIFIDQQIGELLTALDLEKTAVWVLSDHGAKRMDGGFCFNDWLIREGLLVMREGTGNREQGTGNAAAAADQSKIQSPNSKIAAGPRKFEFADVDWSRTRAWGEGGYYGRLFINKTGREPQGIVSAAEYESFRDDLIRRIEALSDHQGRPMGNRAYKPESIYKQVNGVAPDLVVIFGDLHWRSVGSIGNPSVYTFENDTGPDDANHAQQGMYILSHPSLAQTPVEQTYEHRSSPAQTLPAQTLKPAARRDASIYDVTPTILNLLGRPIHADMRGQSLMGR